jgi:hypothetical protein
VPVELGKGGIVSASPKRPPDAVGFELFSVMFTLSHVHEYVRPSSGVTSKEDQLIVVPGPKPKERTPSQWFNSGLKADNDLAADQEAWLLFRSKQLSDFDRMWVERVERADDTFTVTMSRAIWLGPYAANATFHEVHGVNLGKLPAGKYTVKWIVRESGYEEFGKDGWPPKDRKPAQSAELKTSFPSGRSRSRRGSSVPASWFVTTVGRRAAPQLPAQHLDELGEAHLRGLPLVVSSARMPLTLKDATPSRLHRRIAPRTKTVSVWIFIATRG